VPSARDTPLRCLVNEVARGIGQSAQETGVLTPSAFSPDETLEQAIDRAGLKMGNKGSKRHCGSGDGQSERSRRASDSDFNKSKKEKANRAR